MKLLQTLDLTSYQKEFQQYLDKKEWIREPKNLYVPIDYIIQLSGKRIRPILTLMAADILSDDYKKAFPAALAVEVFHNFPLVHDDIMDEVNDWFKHGEFNFGEGEFVGRIEVGDVMSGEKGLSQLEADLTQGYPTFTELVHDVLSEELNDWGYTDDYIFVGSEKPYINTDKHFRYGGAGTINNQHFNDMLVERLSWEYSE